MLAVSALISVLALADLPATAADPLAPARSGQVQCYEPDVAARTCRSLAAYQPQGEGRWVNTATIAVDNGNMLTLDVATAVVERDGAICGAMHREDLFAGRLRFMGKPLPAERAMPMLEKIAGSMAGVLDREICTTYVPGPGLLLARGRLTGNGQALPEQRVIWVRPDAGYHVVSAG